MSILNPEFHPKLFRFVEFVFKPFVPPLLQYSSNYTFCENGDGKAQL